MTAAQTKAKAYIFAGVPATLPASHERFEREVVGEHDGVVL